MKTRRAVHACGLALALVALAACMNAPPADRILINGHIWTGWEEHPEVQAIALRGGRIVAVGDDADIRALAGPSTRIDDLGGKHVVPGFIDSHTHFIEGGRYLQGIDLRDARSEREMTSRLGRHASRLPPGRWIQNGNWDHERWNPVRLPSKHSIDRFTPDHPVSVSRLDGHMVLVNSLALSLAGIRRDTPDPPGGRIDRDASGEPTGILRDTAIDLLAAVIPALTPDEMDEALVAALSHAASLGVTSIHDNSSFADLETFRRARAQGALTLRVYARTPLNEWKRHLDEIRRHGRGDEWLHLGGLKGFMDGSLGSHTAYFFEPYNDEPQTVGLLREDLFPVDRMSSQIRNANAAGLQVTVHAIGDRANSMLLDMFEEAESAAGSQPHRLRIEHAQHLRASDIRRLASQGVIASMQPAHIVDDGSWAEKRIGPERCRTTYAFRSLLDSGVRLAFGSDWPVASLDPVWGVYSAVTRRTIDGRNPAGWIAEEKISAEEALTAYTRDAAFAEFEEHRKGILRPGYLADLVVLSRNILAISPEEIPQVRVELTLVGGSTVFSSPSWNSARQDTVAAPR
ncbi:MAG: amidohydrolase [Acidobacteriota bacterium]